VRTFRSTILNGMLLAVLALVLSGCLQPPTSYSSANPNYDVPDPAMTGEEVGSTVWTQVFGTTSCGTACPHNQLPTINIPTYAIPYPPTGSSAQVPSEALKKLPSGVAFSWAPSVTYLGGQWVMLYVQIFGTHAGCIGEATSTDGVHFTHNSFQYCSPDDLPQDGSHGYLDPSFFVDNSGNVYMLFSEEWPGGSPSVACDDGPNSRLWIVPLASNGLSASGSPTDLLDWDEADSIQALPSNLGPGACLENPQLVNDPNNGYDLLFSIGTYSSNSTYVTGEVACTALNDTSGGCGIDDEGGSVLITPGGGASTLQTATPSGNYLIYAKWDSNVRDDYVGPSTECNPQNTSC
jgi:hypothetical protein